MSPAPGSAERVARNAALKVLGQATRFGSLVLVIVTARILGPAEFGKFTFAYALATVLGIVLDFGISVVLTRAVARDPGAHRRAVGDGVDAEAPAAGPGRAGLPRRAAPHAPPVGHDGGRVAPRAGHRAPDVPRERRGRLHGGPAARAGVPDAPPGEDRARDGRASPPSGSASGSSGSRRRSRWPRPCRSVFAVGRIHRRVAPLDRWWRPAGARRLARELAPVAQAQFLGVATSRLAPVALVLLTGDQAAGHFGAAFRVYDVAWVVPGESSRRPSIPELARTPAALPRFRALTTQAFEALLLVALPIALGLARGRLLADAADLRGRLRSDRRRSWPSWAPPSRARCWGTFSASCSWRSIGPAGCGRSRRWRSRRGWSRSRASWRCGGALGAAVGVLVVEGVALTASLVGRPGPRRLAARARCGQGPGRRGGRPAPSRVSCRRARAGSPGRSLAYAAVLVVLRPIPGPSACASCVAPSGAPARPPTAGVGVMHVVLDARYIARRQSGVGAYTQRLIDGLATIDRANRYTCLVAAEGPGLPVRQDNVATLPTRVSFEDHLRGDLWLLAYLPLRLRALRTDVYHGPAVFLPHVKLGYRTVVTIHDLVSFLFPETVPAEVQPLHAPHDAAGRAVRGPDHRRVRGHEGRSRGDPRACPPSKIVVIHEAVGPGVRAAPVPRGGRRRGPPLRAPAPVLPVRREPRAAQEPAAADRGVRGGAAARRGRGPLGAARARRDARLAP